MVKNKMLQWLIMILISITLIALASFVLWEYMDYRSRNVDPYLAASAQGEHGLRRMSAEEIQKNTVEIKDIMTNLSGGSYIKISFAFLLENSKTKEEFEMLNAKVRASILQTLADLNAEQASGSQGQDLISTALMNKINPILSKGKLASVDITDISIMAGN